MNTSNSEQLFIPIEKRKTAIPRRKLKSSTSSTSIGITATNNGSGPLPKFSFGNAVQAASLAISAQGTSHQGFANTAPTFNFGETSNEFSAVHTPTMSQSSIGGFSMSSPSSTAGSFQFLPSVPSTTVFSFGSNSTTSSSFGSSAPVEQNDDDNMMEDTEQSVPAFTTASTLPTTSSAFSFSIPQTENSSMQGFGFSNVTKAPESTMGGINSLSGEPSQSMSSGFHFTPSNKLFVQAEQNDIMASNMS